ncbi:hypothetical protein NC653_009384 [Populus alba x Populus x berolinensis]|uniref:Uncharacterized protein n=1 Tax=Populus alba x Populus x berolinensis TaxID=444605 RepID=A0AAD6R8U1_9ROSI|nr:hypothetical protein NC653_009384 [Populus alba x Populus x berolinensis]
MGQIRCRDKRPFNKREALAWYF